VDACCSHARSQAIPIAPRGTEAMSLSRQIIPAGPIVASVRLVVFADLSFEGSNRDYDLLLREREQSAAKLEATERELQNAPAKSTDDTRRRIAEIEQQRAALLRHLKK